jgi:hypothetical protein
MDRYPETHDLAQTQKAFYEVKIPVSCVERSNWFYTLHDR